METGAGMMTKKQQARWDALPQEEKDKIDARTMQAAQEYKKAQEESKAVELRKAYNLDPELWRSKNLSGIAALMFVETTLSGDLPSQVTFMENYRGKIRELSRATDTALERSLVEQAGLCWLRLQCVDIAHTQHSNGNMEVLEFWDRRLSAAQMRFDRACMVLAKVRRLALPILLVNIADKQQINNLGQVNNSKS